MYIYIYIYIHIYLCIYAGGSGAHVTGKREWVAHQHLSIHGTYGSAPPFRWFVRLFLLMFSCTGLKFNVHNLGFRIFLQYTPFLMVRAPVPV